jgi:hypothetical protein
MNRNTDTRSSPCSTSGREDEIFISGREPEINTLPNQTASESAEAATATTVHYTSIEKRRTERYEALCKSNLPASVRNMLIDSDWMHGDLSMNMFAHHLKRFAESDERSGCTSTCYLSENDEIMTDGELADMVCEGVIHDDFHNGKSGVNQHFANSIQQVLAVVCRNWLACEDRSISVEQFIFIVNAEWATHERRTAELIGTPAGCIRRAQYRKVT